MNKITDVYCYYTGGGVWMYSARYGEYFLYGSFDQTIDCLMVRGEILYHDSDICDYYGWTKQLEQFRMNGSEEDYYLAPDKIDYPTWQDILDSIRPLDQETYGGQLEYALCTHNPDLTKKTFEED